MAQKTDADFRKEELEYAKTVKRAYAIFLNPQNSEANRIQAVKKYAVAMDQNQNAELKKLVKNTQASDGIRATALEKIRLQVRDDAELLADVLRWVQEPKTPKALREECLSTLGHISFTAFGMQTVPDEILEVYRNLTDDPDIDFRRTAFNFLSARGDDFAQQLLINGIQSPQEGLLPSAECIAYLSYEIKGDYYPVVYNAFKETDDKNTLIEAIRVLGNYAPARAEIVEVLRDNQRDKDVRLAAIKTLNAFDQENFSDHVMPLFRNKNTPEELLVFSIQTEKFRRNNNTVRAKKYKNGRYEADKFDQEVISVSQSDFSNNVIKAARIYVRTLNLE